MVSPKKKCVLQEIQVCQQLMFLQTCRSSYLQSFMINLLSFSDRGDDSGMGSKGDQGVDKDMSEMSVSRLSALAKKGPIQVYIAKYSYDPNKCSPNENPEAELPLHAGDYVLIYGEMDEVHYIVT